MLHRALALIVLILVAARAAGADQPAPVRYRIDFARAPEQLLAVEMTLDAVPAGPLDLFLPVWRPGLYLVLDQSGTVRDVRADAAGAPLPITKTGKASWRVESAGHAALTIRYTVWAGSIENRTRHADDTHAFISPSAVLMYSPAWRSAPAEVRLDAPPDWRIACGLDADPADPRRLLAPDYDTLVDSPIEIGLHDRIDFDIDGVPHALVVWTGLPHPAFADAPRYRRFTGDLAKLTRVQRDIFGSLPYQRYLFLLHVYPGGRGGTEHLNSTIIQCTPEAFAADEPYRNLLALSAHEMFHTWNVKRFRPAGLVPYDYQRENYTDLLWLAEGTTSYYEDITLLRAGLITPADFFKSTAALIDAHQRRPGAKVQSVADSSFDAWIKHNRRTPDAPNSTISFYDKGQLVSLLLDLEIRRRTAGQRSLDDLMRDLWRRFPDAARGYTAADVKAALTEIAGDFSTFFADYIDGVADLDFHDHLAAVGLELHRDAKPARGDEPRNAAPFLGLTVRDQGGHPVVEAVAADSPAARSGLIPGDTLAAIDGLRARADAFDKTIDRRKPGDIIRLAFFRLDALREVEITLDARPVGTLTIRPRADATPEQRAAFRAWTGVDLPERKSAPDAAPAAEAP